MRTKISVKPVYKLSQSEYNAHRRLCFGVNGDIYYRLENFRYDVRARVVSLSDENGKLLSWALAYPVTSDIMKVQLYTRVAARRKGYGTRVLKKAKQVSKAKSVEVIPHDYVSKQFFNKNGLHHRNRI